MKITIIAVSVSALSQIQIFQKEYAKKLVVKALNNQYENVLFSYDIEGYPNEIRITVYDNRKNYKKGKKAFQITYLPCQIDKNVDASRLEILR